MRSTKEGTSTLSDADVEYFDSYFADLRERAKQYSEAQGFSELSKAYKGNPTIENYVALRRAHPTETIEIAIHDGIEWLFRAEDELRKNGINPDLVAAVLDAKESAINELSLQIMEKMIARKKLQKSGHAHVVSRGKAIGDSLIDFLIWAILDSMEHTDQREIPRDLIVLIRERLGVGASTKNFPNMQDNRRNAAFIGAQLAASGVKPTYRAIGNAMGVAASTVKRWFPDDDVLAEMRKLAEMLRLGDHIRETIGDKIKK